MIPLRNIFHYFSVYRGHVGSRLYIVFGLTALAALTEGLGIAMMLPLVTLAVSGTDVPAGSWGGEGISGFTTSLYDFLSCLGIQNSTPGILIAISLVFAAKGAIKFAEGGYKAHLQARLVRELRSNLLDAYATMDYGYYIQHNTGHFVNMINIQIDSLLASFATYKNFLTALIMFTAYLGFAFLMNWPFASMSLVSGALILMLFRRLNGYVRNISRKTTKENGHLNHVLVQTMQGYKYLAATAQIAHLRQFVLRSIQRLAEYQRIQGVAGAFTESLREPLSVAVLVVVIVIQLAVFEAPIAPIMVALLLIHRAMGQVVTLQIAWQKTMDKIGSLEVVGEEFGKLSLHRQQDGDIVLQPLSHGVEFRHVSFSYESNACEVLKDINLFIPANSTVAFVGESGSGKTTLLDLMCLLLLPTSGIILVDNKPHLGMELGSWRRQIGYVSQDTVIFDDTIANNINLWQGDYNCDLEVRRGIHEAAEAAFARGFIEELPEGFNTLVGDRGVRLSGGQRQRLFVARELYKKSNLLILDEATSALDSESEAAIQKSIERIKGTTTVIIVAHRLSTIKNADYIYVLDKGRIVEQGSFDELIVLRGSFNHMVSLQKIHH